MNPILLENFFTPKELSDLRKYIYERLYHLPVTNKSQQEVVGDGDYYKAPALISEQMGRVNMYFPLYEVPEVFDKVEKFMKNLDPELKYFYATFARYNLVYGEPNLGPHMDSNFESITTLDVQINANTNWNMNIEGTEYHIENNSALIFKPAEVVHWRPRKTFKDGQFVEIVLIDYINLDKKLEMPEEKRRELAEPWFKVYDSSQIL